jgi:sugar fermentation stimulation protein A
VYPDGVGYFPDSESERAKKHVEALTRLVKKGVPATVLFTVQRDDAQSVRPSALHDPAFALAMRRAVKAGVTTRAVTLIPSLEGFTFGGEIPVDTEPYDVEATRPYAKELEATTGWDRKDGGVSGRVLKSSQGLRAQRSRK